MPTKFQVRIRITCNVTKNKGIARWKVELDILISVPIYIIFVYGFLCFFDNASFHKRLFTDMGYGLIGILVNDARTRFVVLD